MKLERRLFILPLSIGVTLWIIGAYLLNKINAQSFTYFIYLMFITAFMILIQAVIAKLDANQKSNEVNRE